MENKIVKQLTDLNAYITFECSDLTTEEYKGISKRIETITNDVLNMRIVSRSKPIKEEKHIGDFKLDNLTSESYEQMIVNIDKSLDYEQSIIDKTIC
jgi:hypothetical protein